MCFQDIGRLRTFVSPTKKQDASLADDIEPLPQRLTVAEVTRCKSVDSRRDLGLRPGVGQFGEPIIEGIFATPGYVIENVDGMNHCNL